MRKNPSFFAKDIEAMTSLYWDEGYDQQDIADIYGTGKSHVSKLLNGKSTSIEVFIASKIAKFNEAIKHRNEAPQAMILRRKRETLHNTKLTWKDACSIRKLYFSGSNTQVELSIMFGVKQSTISLLLSGAKWRPIVL